MSDLALLIRPRSSRALRIALLLIYCSACAGLLLVDLEASIRLLLGAVLLFCLWREWRLLGGYARDAPQELYLGPGGCWVRDRDGQRHETLRLHTAFVRPWLVMAQLQAGNRRFRLLLGPDSLDAEQHRRLRTALRWAGNCRESGSSDSPAHRP